MKHHTTLNSPYEALDDQDGIYSVQPRAYSLVSDCKALSAPALPLDVRIAEAKRFVQPLLHEIDLGAVDKAEALAIDDDFDPLILVHQIVRADLVGIVHDVGEAGTAGLLHAEAQADTVASTPEERPD